MSSNKQFQGHIVWFDQHILDNFGTHEHETVYSAAIQGHLSGTLQLAFDWQRNAGMEGGLVKLFSEDGKNFSGQGSYLEEQEIQAAVKAKLYFSALGTSVLTGTWNEQGRYYHFLAEFKTEE
ncbi:MAG: hypothetical protein RLZZ370_240 [Bacteroidota bacterium]